MSRTAPAQSALCRVGPGLSGPPVAPYGLKNPVSSTMVRQGWPGSFQTRVCVCVFNVLLNLWGIKGELLVGKMHYYIFT